DYPCVRILQERRNDKVQLPGGPPVVAIEERHDFGLAFRDACVEGGSLASVGFADQADLRNKLGDNFWRVVLRAVVHHEDFAAGSGEVLLQNAEDGPLNKALVVVSVDQNADEWCR